MGIFDAARKKWRGGPLYRARATIVLVVSLILSVGGIWFAILPADAGRGGALAVALSLYILFFSESPGLKTFSVLTIESNRLQALFEKLEKEPPEENTTEERVRVENSAEALAARTEAIEAHIKKLDARLSEVCQAFVGCQAINEKAHFRINFQMALGSAIGTLTWGFGDWMHPLFH